MGKTNIKKHQTIDSKMKRLKIENRIQTKSRWSTWLPRLFGRLVLFFGLTLHSSSNKHIQCMPTSLSFTHSISLSVRSFLQFFVHFNCWRASHAIVFVCNVRAYVCVHKEQIFGKDIQLICFRHDSDDLIYSIVCVQSAA